MSATLTSRTITDALNDEGLLDEQVVIHGTEEKGDFAAPPLAERKSRPAHPGAILRELYWPVGHSLSAVAQHLGVSRHALNLLLGGQRPVTVDLARRLAQAFGTSPQFWLNLQHNVDVWDALHASENDSKTIVPFRRRLKVAARP